MKNIYKEGGKIVLQKKKQKNKFPFKESRILAKKNETGDDDV